jgi:serine/threonine protein kinase/tetratricopeptide (TPR) repeat protein
VTVEEIFLAAIEKSPDDREAYLAEACGGGAGLRARVEALLRSDAEAGSLLERPLFQPGSTLDQSPPMEGPGTVIGPYKLVEEIGEGGMGTVWLAQQTEPVRRLVAVKLIKSGMDSKQVLARFEAERQAVALMDHPNIAKVHDAGTTPAGRPYFVMELVKGVPITKYCDQHRLTPRQRLELFVPVCQAIQHAHQKGVIHRDVKPSNVLVAMYDDRPVPQVIDFGVAKATGQRLTEQTLHTGFGAVVGTLEYMSPEQAGFNQLDVDTRSDVYSLGVLLYELLAGSPPFAKKELERAGVLEMLRVIREQEPSRPSTKLSTADGLPTLAANRGTEPARLTKLVRGELDWIVMRALEKDRSRRYETANGFAADVQRYLAGEAVQAVPPSAGYRLRKFARRNRGPVAAALVVLLTLGGGIVGTTLGLLRAERARQAEAERADAERRAKLEVEERAEETRAMLDFVENGILVARLEGMDEKSKLRRAVEEALPFVDRFADRPLIEARLRLTLAAAFSSLGEYKIAADLAEAAQNLYAKHRGSDHPDTLAARNTLAGIYPSIGREVEALMLRKEVIAIQKSQHGLDHADTLESMWNLACYYTNIQRVPEGRKLCDEILSVLALRKAELGPGHTKLLRSMADQSGNFPPDQPGDAAQMLEEVLAIQKAKLGPTHAETLATVRKLADYYYFASNRRAEGLKLFEEVVALQKVNPGLDYAETLESMMKLANIYTELHRHAESLKLREEMLAIQKVKLPPANPQTLAAMTDLAENYATLNRHAESLKLREESLAILKAKPGPDGPDLPVMLGAMTSLADYYATLNRHAEALKVREELLALRRAKYPAKHPEILASMNSVADSYTSLGRHAEALRIREEVLTIQTTRHTAVDQPEMPESMTRVADTYAALGRHADAEANYKQSLELYKGLIIKNQHDPKYFQHLAAVTATKLGEVQLLGTRKAEEAEARFAEAVKLCDCPEVHCRIGNAYARHSEWNKAAGAFRTAVDRNPKYAAYGNLAQALRKQGKVSEAVEAYRKAIELEPRNAAHHNNLGGLLCDDLKDYDKAIECFRKAIELDPKLANARQGLGTALGYKSWNLVGSPDPKSRDPKRAIEAAREAVELDPRSFHAWQWLGWVRYRAGDWPGSIEALEKSCKLENGGDHAQWIVLALAHARLAAQEGLPEKERNQHQAEARRRYEQAEKQAGSLGARPPGGGMPQALWDFRAEARELIGPKDGKK